MEQGATGGDGAAQNAPSPPIAAISGLPNGSSPERAHGTQVTEFSRALEPISHEMYSCPPLGTVTAGIVMFCAELEVVVLTDELEVTNTPLFMTTDWHVTTVESAKLPCALKVTDFDPLESTSSTTSHRCVVVNGAPPHLLVTRAKLYSTQL